MAIPDGRLSRSYNYELASRELIVHSVQGEETIKLQSETLFEYMQREQSKIQIQNPVNVEFDFRGGFIGYFGYEMKAESLHGHLHSSVPQKHKKGQKDALFYFVERYFVWDHVRREISLVYLEDVDGEANVWFERMSLLVQRSFEFTYQFDELPTWSIKSVEMRDSKDAYLEKIKRAKEYLEKGDSYELCLTTSTSLTLSSTGDEPVDPFQVYLRLRNKNPAPYSAYITSRRFGYCILSTSPELFISMKNSVVEMKPIKGTIARPPRNHPDFENEDEKRKEALRGDIKNQCENLMIVDLIRHDLNGVSVPGSVTVPKLFSIESYESVHQMVTTVRSRVEGKGCFQVIQSVFPPGSMTGAPKVRSCRILEELEREQRGVYSGCCGFVSLDGACKMNVVIRTAVAELGRLDLDSSDGLKENDKGGDLRLSIGSGGAIIMLSDPTEEWEEMRLKVDSVLKCLS